VRDGEAELRDASQLWGRFTADAEEAIWGELGDQRIRVIQCGPAAENGVRFSALINNANRANGRTGMGLVMASKNLKAIAVRGHQRPGLADARAVRALAKWGADHLQGSGVARMNALGTAGGLLGHDRSGNLPTRNWSSGTFPGAEAISGEEIHDTILKERDTCFGCVVRCKTAVEVTEGPYEVNPRYGGPEYETLGMLGAACAVDDLVAVARANQLCNMYGMDTISCGATIAWAMDCFERGLLTEKDTGGMELRFGNASALVELVDLIGKREGFGRVLGEGSERAARLLGVGEELVVTSKGQEYPAHTPHHKRSFALIYLVNPFGADHQSSQHDPTYGSYADRYAPLALLDPQPTDVLNGEKVQFALYSQYWNCLIDSVNVCQFTFGPAWQLYDCAQLVEAVRAVTGWETSLWELMKVGERRLNLLQAFNAREGFRAEEEVVPPKMLVPFQGGATDGVTVTKEEVTSARSLYYRMAGWDADGRPTRAKLEELALGWVADKLGLP
jgi:aldehyde:ferredoxin oxidoreductase